MDTGHAHARFRDLLYRHGHGYPFWFPEPNDNLPADQRAEGMRVGDVGILTDDGGFEYLWNIHLPATHPHNTLAPPNFAHIELDETRDVRKLNKCFDEDTAITSTSVKKREIKVDGEVESGAAGGIAGGTGGFEFTAEGNSGAILTLPRGGVRKNANKLNVYMQEARKSGTSWYRHINGTLQRGMENGALYLVTGTDKCSSWGVASFATSSESHGLTLKFMVSGAANSGASVSNSWSADFGVEHRAKVVDEGELSQCVFARGYTISLRDKLFVQIGAFGVRVTSPDRSESRPPLFGSRRPYSRSANLDRAPSNVQSVQENRTRDADAGENGSPDADADVRVMRIPEDNQIQKSIAALLGDELLNQNPDAVVAIVHDDDWIASTRSDDFWQKRAADNSQSDLEDLVYHALTHSLAVVVDGVCTLVDAGGVAPSGDTSLGRDLPTSRSGRPPHQPERGPAGRAGADVLPIELWLRVIDYLRKPIVYHVSETDGGGPLRPAPGSASGVGPLARPADKDCVALASTCRYFRQLLLDEVAFGELHVCLRAGQLVRHSGGRGYQLDLDHNRLKYRDLSTAPFGDRTRRLAISFSVEDGNQEVLEAITDAAADAILARVPNLIALEVHVHGALSGNRYPVSEKLARSMAALPLLVDLIFLGCHLPRILSLQFPNVRRIQTDHAATSLYHFPNLRELRNDQSRLQEVAYHIPVDVFRKLEVLHYCPPYDLYNPGVINRFPENCEELRASVTQRGDQMRLQELVLRHTMHPRCVERIITALASPQLRVFACYDVTHHNEFDKLLALAKRAFPNAAIDFPDTRSL